MSETEQFWRKHLDAIDASGLTTKVYAEQNQLKAIELYKWRNHFRRQAERLRKQQSGFMRVNLESAQSRPAPLATARPGIARTITLHGMHIELANLPPVNWLHQGLIVLDSLRQWQSRQDMAQPQVGFEPEALGRLDQGVDDCTGLCASRCITEQPALAVMGICSLPQ